MDPHSTHSQFNQKTPRSRTKALDTKFVDPMAHSKSKPSPTSKPLKKTTDLQTSSLVLRRPIATNSRVKQDERYKKSMYLAFVHNALHQKTNGVNEPFNELVNQFNLKSTPGESVTQLRFWLLALSHVVSRLERTHSALLHAIVNMPWTMLDSATVKTYTVFMGMLISARPEYLSLVLGKIAQGFTHQSGSQALEAGMPEGSSSPLTKRIIYDRLHDLLRHLLSIIPTLPSTLQPHLVRNFPHKRQNEVAQTTYIRNLLRISVYCPELADKILATIVERAIQIDVEIQVEIEELEDGGDTGPEVFELDPFDTVVGQDVEHSDTGSDDDNDDQFSDMSSDAEEADDAAEAPELTTNFVYIQDMVKKLDAILTLVFDHFHRNYTSITTSGALQAPPPLLDLPPIDVFPSSPLSSPTASFIDTQFLSQPSSTPLTPTPPPPPNQDPISSQETAQRKNLLRTQFHTLLSIFDRTILRTFKSRYTQFLLFWYTSLDSEFADVFQGMLVERALLVDSLDLSNNGTSPVTRAAAASYIGSFVSRATFVDRDDARRIVGLLCDFLGAHLDSVEELAREGALGNGGVAQHTVFYAVAQAVFLIFCFRWRDLQEGEDGDRDDEFLISHGDKGRKKWIPQLGTLQRVVNCVLNPLRVCSANVVAQFAHVAHATNFLYCYTILGSNKRPEYGAKATKDSSSSQNTGFHPSMLEEAANPELNTFFPFDPYRLSKSNAYIQGIYREWSTVAIDDDDNDDDNESDHDDEDDEGHGSEKYLASSGFLSIPSSDALEPALGKSLGAMSISPA